MTGLLSLKDLNTTVNHEPRLHDLLIAGRLGFARPRKIRETIERNLPELEQHGPVTKVDVPASPHGGAGVEYYLNEAQALLICMFSRTERAAAVRKAVIEVYQAYRAGTLASAPVAPTPAAVGRILGRVEIDGKVVAYDDLIPHAGPFWAVVVSTGLGLSLREVIFIGPEQVGKRVLMKVKDLRRVDIGNGMAALGIYTLLGRAVVDPVCGPVREPVPLAPPARTQSASKKEQNSEAGA